jgi:hypothetical protein
MGIFMFRKLIAASLLLASVPAAAVVPLTFNFGGTVGNANSVTYAQTALSLTATAVRFQLAPGLLTGLSDTLATGKQIRTTGPGIGVTGGQSAQVDTNTPGTVANPQREAILITGTKLFSLVGLQLSSVDANDTLKVYGVNTNGSFVDLGYGTTATAAGTIRGGLNAAALNNNNQNGLNGGTSTFDLARTSQFTRFLFTTRIAGDDSFLNAADQGYRLNRLVAVVPEAQTWALMVVGFGLVGLSMRRRKAVVAA